MHRQPKKMGTYVIGPPRCQNSRRQGVVMLEAALVLGVFLTMLLGTLDLGLALLRRNVLVEGAHRLARQAIVRGKMAPPQRSAWGPAPYSGTAADGTEIAQAVLPGLVCVELGEISIDLEWPDGGNNPGQRVRVSLGYRHEPLIPFLYGHLTIDLSAVSVMQIAH